MPPSMKLGGTPIVIDLQALRGENAREINLDKLRSTPKDAIRIEELDPLMLLVASRRKVRR